jgi:hypothetical protein
MKPQLNIIPAEVGEALVVGKVVYDTALKIGPFTYFQSAYKIMSKKGNTANVRVIATAVSHSPVSARKLLRAKVRKLEAKK